MINSSVFDQISVPSEETIFPKTIVLKTQFSFDLNVSLSEYICQYMKALAQLCKYAVCSQSSPMHSAAPVVGGNAGRHGLTIASLSLLSTRMLWPPSAHGVSQSCVTFSRINLTIGLHQQFWALNDYFLLKT